MSVGSGSVTVDVVVRDAERFAEVSAHRGGRFVDKKKISLRHSTYSSSSPNGDEGC